VTALQRWIDDKFSQVELWLKDMHGYQDTGSDFMWDNPASALFIDTGLGKTGTALHLIYRLRMAGDTDPVLVIGPIRVVEVTWPDEIAKWSFSSFLTYEVIKDDDLVSGVNKAGQAARRQAKLNGCSKDLTEAMVKEARRNEAKRLVMALMVDRPADIYSINREAIEFLVDAFGKHWPFKTVIIDESSCLKDHTTKRWKAMWKVRLLIKRMHQLTATPTTEGYIHLFAQITLLDGGKRFGKSFRKWADKFFTHNQYTRKYTLREGAEKDIMELISDICMVMRDDSPKPDFIIHPVKINDQQMALYRSMERGFIVELPDGTEVEAESAAALNQKLSQMASGVLYEEILEEVGEDEFQARRVVHHIHDGKIEALKQLQEELNGESMLVAYYHQASLDRLLAAFPEAKVMDKKGKLIKEWNAGKIPILLLHPQSGAHGLNLQKGGRHCVFFDLIWSEELHYQFWRRLARQGQEWLVMVHYLIVKGTIDDLYLECLQNKRDLQETFFKLLNRIRARLRRAMKKREELAQISIFNSRLPEDDEL